jgi:hypothetical protein
LGFCKHRNTFQISTKCVEFLDYLSPCWQLKKDSVPWNWSISESSSQLVSQLVTQSVS